MACERFIFVCHPLQAETWLSKRRHVTLCVVSTMLILFGFLINTFRELSQGGSVVPWEVVVSMRGADFLLFFLIPAILCGIMNFKVAVALKNMMTNERRNLQLSRSLMVTSFCWVLTWAPYACVEISTITKHTGYYGSEYEALQELTRDLCMLYSFLNPIVFITLIRHFQEPLKKVIDRCHGTN